MFLYLAVGGADAVSRGASEGTAVLGIAFAFGMGLMVTAWAFGRISGAQFNPAITLSCLIVGKLSVGMACLYLICQLLGGSLGVAMARGNTPSNVKVGGINHLDNGESLVRGFFLEFWLTSILCFVYLMTTEERSKCIFMAALPIGFTLFSCHLFALRYDNAAINPARAFATSLVSRNFTSDHWIYWIGPLCGGILAAALYILFCYFDPDIVGVVDKDQYRAENAAASGETVKIDVDDANKNDMGSSTRSQIAPSRDETYRRA
jgi:aquaporin related protein